MAMINRKKSFTPSISNIALIFLFVVATFFIGIGLYAYISLQFAHKDIQENNRLAAEVELRQAVDKLVMVVDDISAQVSDWDEIHQQLENPAYYSYWRQYRLLKSNVIPVDIVESSEVFDKNGRVLAELSDSHFPKQIDIESLEPHLETDSGHTTLVVYSPIKQAEQGGEIAGYIGIRIPFIESLLRDTNFRYIDAQTLTMKQAVNTPVSLANVTDYLSFDLKTSPEASMMMSLVKSTVIQLATIVGLLCLAFYFLMVYILGKPLVEISEYIDRLLFSNPGSLTGGVNRLLPVAELEKVKASLNKYHADLEKAQDDLDEKSQELWVLAHHDTLTGVLNRRAFENEWTSSVELLSRKNIGIGLILFDVNHFKAINDTYGHQAGDEVLRVISQCIQKILKKSEKLYRIGGDEFATVIIGSNTQYELMLAQQCIDAVQSFNFSAMGIKETVRISCGIAHCNADQVEQLNNLQRQADIAVYHAKRPGINHPILFTDDMADGTEAVFSNWISTAVYDAVSSSKGIEMHYQPIVNSNTRETCYYEALLRIRHNDEVVPPSHIFPVVTMRRLEVDLDKAIIKTIKRDLDNQLIPRGSGVSLNLSAESIAHKDVIDWLMPLTDYTQSYYIVIEVTETSLITQISTAARSLTILRKLGFKIALDDFGSGYSSLRYLTSMPVDIIKFDISLVQGMMDERLANLVEQMAAMLSGLGYDLVAEGIESDSLLEKVNDAGFKLSQGYLFGGPTRDRATIYNGKQPDNVIKLC